jgi:hypothetical protein
MVFFYIAKGEDEGGLKIQRIQKVGLKKSHLTHTELLVHLYKVI